MNYWESAAGYNTAEHLHRLAIDAVDTLHKISDQLQVLIENQGNPQNKEGGME